MDLSILRPSASLLGCAVLLDLAFGDPVYPFHPVRLMGRTLSWLEEWLRRLQFNGYGGGIALFLLLASIWCVAASSLAALLAEFSYPSAAMLHVFFLYSMLALRDLLQHAWKVEKAASNSDLEGARRAIAQLVGRDTSRMDIAACRRAAVESVSENLADGFTSPLFWYALAGLPGILLFKLVSTMDSMVGYKTPRYLNFGWCGARLDDLLNLAPARLTWLLISIVAIFIPKCSARKALQIGWNQHALVPGPNAGWSEAAIAGALQRRLVGPIWSNGQLVTETWLGDPADPPLESHSDLVRALKLVATSGVIAAVITGLVIILVLWT